MVCIGGCESFKPGEKEISLFNMVIFCLLLVSLFVFDFMGTWFEIYCFGYIGNPLFCLTFGIQERSSVKPVEQNAFAIWDLGRVIWCW